jgi:hypothetical protein
VFSTVGTWPRSRALYCHPLGLEHWPDDAEVVERTGLRSCRRRGAAIDLILDRSRHNRSQLVFTTARGRDAVFWQTPRVRKQARPRSAHRPPALPVSPSSRSSSTPTSAIPTGSAAKPCAPSPGRCRVATTASWSTGVSSPPWSASRSPTSWRASPAASCTMPWATWRHFRGPRWWSRTATRRSTSSTGSAPAAVADGLAEYQVRWANVPIVFCETRQLAEEWTYRFLAAAYTWAQRTRRCSVSCVPEGTSATHVRSRLIARDRFGAVGYAP